MQMTLTIEIDGPIATVWEVLATDFDKASDWMSFVTHSYKTSDKPAVEQAPMAGRVCEFSANPDAMFVNEAITSYDEEAHTLTIEIHPENTPAMFPVRKNEVTISLVALSDDRTEVQWRVAPILRPLGYVMYPMLRFGMVKSFRSVLEELKFYVEEGQPHPRKVAAQEKHARAVLARAA